MEVIFYSVKLLNLFYIGVFYFILGSIVASIVTYVTPSRKKEELKKIGIIRLYFETVVLSSILFIMIYFCRKIVKITGSPFHNIEGFDFYRLKEINGGIVLSLALILFSPKLIAMTHEISDRFSETKEQNGKIDLIKELRAEYKLILFVLALLIILIAIYFYRKNRGGFEIKANNKVNNKVTLNKKSGNGNSVAFNTGGNSSNGGI
jgi:hypothetical protein